MAIPGRIVADAGVVFPMSPRARKTTRLFSRVRARGLIGCCCCPLPACCLCCLADAAGAADAVDAGVSSMLVVFADSSPAAAWCCPADAGPVGRPGGRAALEHDREVPGVRQLPGTALILVAHGRAALLHSQSLFLLVSRLRPVRLSSASRSLAKYRRS